MPCCISDLLNYRTSERTLRSSFQHLLATPKARLKTCGERTFPVAGPGLWNSIPLELRSSSSIDIFKRHFRTYPFKQASKLFKKRKTLYGFQSTLLTQLLKLNYPVILSHPRSTKISLETPPSNKRKLGFFSIKHLMHKPFDLFGKYPQGNK